MSLCFEQIQQDWSNLRVNTLLSVQSLFNGSSKFNLVWQNLPKFLTIILDTLWMNIEHCFIIASDETIFSIFTLSTSYNKHLTCWWKENSPIIKHVRSFITHNIKVIRHLWLTLIHSDLFHHFMSLTSNRKNNVKHSLNYKETRQLIWTTKQK